MPTLLPLLRRLSLLLLAVSLALPPLVAEAFPGTPEPDAVQAEDAHVPPCHGRSQGHEASAVDEATNCSLICLWLCAHANALASSELPLVASAAPAGPVQRRASLLHGPVLPVLLRPPIV